MPDIVFSVFGTPIRLTDERWGHIASGHPELAGLRADVLRVLAHPGEVRAGSGGELFAISNLPEGRSLVVVYRELTGDGFIVTALLTRRTAALGRRRLVWQSQPPPTS